MKKHFITQLSNYSCHSVQIRIFNSISLIDINNLLSIIKNKRISSLELMIKHDSILSENDLFNLFNICDRLSFLVVFGAPYSKTTNIELGKFGFIFYIKEEIVSEKSCGLIDPSLFVINMKTYTESLHHNSCLNRKISIDTEGNIKNCPSMSESFGNIRNTTLAEAIELPQFKKYWDINKDMIHVCKDCEFRYICTDCRAYVEDPDDILSKPLKCGYNPYTGEWSDLGNKFKNYTYSE
ncbi:MAG: hypothetical protein RLZZ546_202 [Bacteroidota bacterium]|jgi:SPASM domain peptide maturase of grasp-with-spasm system